MTTLTFFVFFAEFLTTFFAIITVQVTISSNYHSDHGYKFALPILVQIFVICSYLMLFNAILYYLKMRFEALNQILKTKFNLTKDPKTLKKWNLNIITSKSEILVLKITSESHILLNDVIKLMNTIFSLPIAIFMTYNLFGCTFSLYETYDLMSTSRKNLRHIGYNVAISLFNIHYFVYIFIVVAMSMSVTGCRNETCDVLMKILHGKFDKKLKQKVRIFILQIKHSRAEFSCGLFNFDWMLLYSVRLKVFDVWD